MPGMTAHSIPHNIPARIMAKMSNGRGQLARANPATAAPTAPM